MRLHQVPRYLLSSDPGPLLVHPVHPVRTGGGPKGSTVLYAHLGGQPAVNAYHSLWR